MRGEASDDGRVYQARRDQQITHQRQYIVNVHMERGADAEAYRGRAEQIITVLLHTVGSLQDRCTALEEQAERARSEGRAQALSEIHADLQASELRLMQVQRRLQEAQQDRDTAELLLIEARREAEEFRREAEELRRRQEPAAAEERPGRVAAPVLEDYDRLMATADAELADLRESLRRLTGEMAHRLDTVTGGGVVAGEVLDGAAATPPAATPSTAATPPAAPPPTAATPRSAPRPPRAVVVPGQAPVAGAVRDVPQDQTAAGAPAAAHASAAPAGQRAGRAPQVKAAGLRATLLGTVLSLVPLLLCGVSIRVLFGGEGPGPAVVWTLVYVVVSVPLAWFAGLFVKFLVLTMSTWDGEHEIGVKMAFHLVFGVSALLYALILPASLGSWTTAVARFAVEWLGPL
ncbi:hypothetical protein [Streptomyces sp. NPDC047928]|uniref:hypothetical protein n=1 Tax=unclassified Streptomyces TaxID=2593676 RepID=UPI00372348D6